ncbi:WxL domain-containing protein [Vagococcus xieshaowenii]|uniref:WxL domain-containing protein n=1 Tax=Vagococcus xieshaowenii TaxID=2562451 RepID=A0AAJ5EGN4_9ENTE|nr:WxL domain-containing protein [Vagococcus xieshaowenii]QCA29548.1 WxL domain-containing protein [Vagococcus xieshaowenii]TFZ42664.1 WxL domain-containing protein [Vagococcus xieshaowenii]
MKKVISSLMLSTMVLGGVVVNAAGTGTDIDPATGTATINFTKNEQVPGPVNPTDPSQPIDPDDPNKPSEPGEEPGGNNGQTGAKGPLSLDVYPKIFDFGSHEVDMKGGTYNSTLTGNHYLQVTDNRDDADGWSVKVSRTEFVMNDGTNQLAGSTLTLPTGEARNALNETPTVIDTDLIIGGETSIPVGADNAKTIFGSPAVTGTGKSTSTYVWDASQETLTVPKNVAKSGTYTSTINWTLVSEVAQ